MRKKLLILVVTVIAIATILLASTFYQASINSHMYPQDAIHENSNLSIRGTVSSIEQNHVSPGMVMGSYHIFRLFIQLNITEIVWTNEQYLNSSINSHTILGSNLLSIGYDNLDKPQLAIGWQMECKGFYLGATDSPYSFILTVAPSISGSYLKQQI